MAQGRQEQDQPKEIQKAAETPSTGVERVKAQGLERSAPYSALRRLMDEMDRLTSGFGLGFGALPTPMQWLGGFEWAPVIETVERDGNLVFRADLPGLGKNDVKVEIIDDELVVSGERKQEREESKRGRYYSERRYGAFERRIALPENFDPENVKASFDNGVLEISVATPERKEAKSRTIEIKSSPAEEGEKEVESAH